MNTPVQSERTINRLKTLLPTDLSLDQGAIDPSQMVQTFNQDANWIGLTPTVLDSEGTSINGAAISADELDFTVRFGTAPSIEMWRFYPNVHCVLTGGSVASINCRLVMLVRGLGVSFFGDVAVANPGAGNFGPVLLAPGLELRCYNVTHGGAGDTIRWYAHGFAADPGVGFPMLPTVSYTPGV